MIYDYNFINFIAWFETKWCLIIIIIIIDSAHLTPHRKMAKHRKMQTRKILTAKTMINTENKLKLIPCSVVMWHIVQLACLARIFCCCCLCWCLRNEIFVLNGWCCATEWVLGRFVECERAYVLRTCLHSHHPSLSRLLPSANDVYG